MSSQRMATPSRPRKNDGAGTMAKRTATRRGKSEFDLKQTLLTTALWTLGIINVIQADSSTLVRPALGVSFQRTRT